MINKKKKKVLEGQRVALDESILLKQVHDKHCTELAKAIVTNQFVNQKITRLSSYKKSKTKNLTPLKTLGSTPSRSDSILRGNKIFPFFEKKKRIFFLKKKKMGSRSHVFSLSKSCKAIASRN